jgi:2'-5' RNA ligase
LGFLGPVEESSAREAWGVVGRYDSFRPVVGSFSGVQALGNRRKPSAISAVVAEGARALSEMITQSRALVLAAADAPPDDRPPLPHVTVARIQRRAKAAERRAALGWADALDLTAASFVASSVALYTWASNREQRLFDIVERRHL